MSNQYGITNQTVVNTLQWTVILQVMIALSVIIPAVIKGVGEAKGYGKK